jgi:hypothetical protein
MMQGICYLKSWERFEVEVEGTDLIVCLPKAAFKAVYYKATGQPQLILRHRTKQTTTSF